MNNIGISLYLGSGIDKNKEVVNKAAERNIKYAFTSLHIREETVQNYKEEVDKLLQLCKSAGLELIVDIGPRTMEKLGLKSICDLKDTPIKYLRVDYGFSASEIVMMSRSFKIVFNASTLTKDEIFELKAKGMDFCRAYACHNFYPKPLTGLSLRRILDINEKLSYYGIRTMAFVAGDMEFRGPLYKGLPTAEGHRNKDVLYNMLQLIKICKTDMVFVGDIDIADNTWKQIGELNHGYVSLKADIDKKYDYIRETIHHDRVDSSDYVIRSQESRGYAEEGRRIVPEKPKKRYKGSLSIGNELYKRYSGELEIARIDLENEEKVNIIGHVKKGYLKYLDYISDGLGFKFER